MSSTERKRLERRPEATSSQVDDLLAKMRSGQFRLPHFQRALKWKDRDRLDLFDSLYRGFPIGTLLLWKASAKAGRVSFGELDVEVDARPDALWVVDGQQRMSALATGLLVPYEGRSRVLLFDLLEERFTFGPPPAQTPTLPGIDSETRLVAVQELFDSTRAISWMASRMKTLKPELIQRALDCGKRLREYQLPVYIVETDDETVLREVFDRINRTGRRLDDTDVFAALFATMNEQGERLDLAHVGRRVASVGFGTLDENTVLASLRAIMDLPLDKDFTRGLELTKAGGALARTEAALSRAARFLQESGIPHVALLPYALIAVVLARFFDRHPEPKRRSAILLRRWLWRGSLAGKLTGATVGLRQHVEAVTADEDATVQALLRLEGDSAASPSRDFGVFRLDTARSKLEACALASLEPRDLRSGELLDIVAIFESDPKRPLPEIVGADVALSRTVANRLLHLPLRGRELASALSAADAATRSSHAITDEAVTALLGGDAEKFLELRAHRLAEIFDGVIDRYAEYGADDSPPLDGIIVDEAS